CSGWRLWKLGRGARRRSLLLAASIVRTAGTAKGTCKHQRRSGNPVVHALHSFCERGCRVVRLPVQASDVPPIRPPHSERGAPMTEHRPEGISGCRNALRECSCRLRTACAPRRNSPMRASQNRRTPCRCPRRVDESWHAACIRWPDRHRTTDRSSSMNDWIDTTNLLPTEREYVRFLVVGHTRCMLGIYENHNFHSRWGAYKDREVRMWNKVGDAPMDPPPERTHQDQSYWSDRPMREGRESVSE